MDGMLFNPKSWLSLSILVVLAAGGAGCQTTPPVSVPRLLNYQAMIDFSGLSSVQQYDVVKAQAAPPQTWKELVPKRSSMYNDMQWRAPSGNTAVGVAHVKMPLPLDARTLVWFAKSRYAKQSEDGRLIGQWVDDLGRSWFEAWIIYSGFKTQEPIDTSELALGARSMETIVPQIGPKRAVAPTSSNND